MSECLSLKYGRHIFNFHQIGDDLFHFGSDFFRHFLFLVDGQREERPDQITIDDATRGICGQPTGGFDGSEGKFKKKKHKVRQIEQSGCHAYLKYLGFSPHRCSMCSKRTFCNMKSRRYVFSGNGKQ